MLQPEVVVQVAGEMFLDAEEPRLALALCAVFLCVADRFRGFREIALAPIVLQSHTLKITGVRSPRRQFSVADQTRQRLSEQQHQEARYHRHYRHDAKQLTKRHRAVEGRGLPTQEIANRRTEEPDTHHEADDARGGELGHRAQSHRTEAEFSHGVHQIHEEQPRNANLERRSRQSALPVSG